MTKFAVLPSLTGLAIYVWASRLHGTLFFWSFSFRARVGMMFLFRLDPDAKKPIFSKSSGPQKFHLTWMSI